MNQQIWPGWETVRVIGNGGFGKVYEIQKAEDSKTGDYRSALKVITIPQSPDDYRAYEDDGYDEKSISAIFKEQIDGIVSEFQMMSQFKGTSNIVSYEDHMIVPHSDGRGWDILIRMELLTPLPEYIHQNGLTEGQAIQMGSDICRALELCGQRGIIHRDIKPQNIFVNEFGDFKLGDFGIARTMDHTTKATKTGTYSYMAPEVYSNKPYGASVDIYSLGLVLYWALNERRLPFVPVPPAIPTAGQNNEAQSRRLRGDAIPAPKNGNPMLKAVVLKACAFSSKDRFVSPEAFAAALNECSASQNKVLNAATRLNEPVEEGGEIVKWWIACPSCGARIEQYADAAEISYCGRCGSRIGASDSDDKTKGQGTTGVSWEPVPSGGNPPDSPPRKRQSQAIL